MKIVNVLGNNLLQLWAVLAGTINAISDGMQYGWTSPIISVLKSPDSPVEISEGDDLSLELSYLLGCILGLPLTVILINRAGRKWSVVYSSIVGLIGWIFVGAGRSVLLLNIGRFILGLTADVAFNSSPMYVSEIASPDVRGFLSGIINIMMLVGVILIYCIGHILPIYASSLIGALILLIQIIVFPFMPDSPYFLLFKGKREEARRSLQKFRGGKDVTDELNEIEKAVEKQKEERGRPLDLFLVKSNRKACFIMFILNSTQHFVGVTALVMNMQSILEAAGSTLISASNASIIFSCFMLISALLAAGTMDKFGKKILLIASGIMTAICLFILAIYFHLKHYNNEGSFNWLPTVVVMIYAAVFKLGLGIVPITITAEVFTAKFKGLGLCVSDGVYLTASPISIYLYKYMEKSIGIHGSFYLFGCYSIFATVLIGYFVPETSGKTLDEIQMILKH